MTNSPQIVVPDAAPLTAGSCRVIAEAGANHNNSVDRAIEMAVEAKAAGAWAVKFQLYKADRLAIEDSPKYWDDEIGTATQHDAFKLSDHLDYADYARVASKCRDIGIVFFATPFDVAAIEALERMDVPIYKVASGDITDKPLLEAIAQTGKPIMLSTGAATVCAEIEDAITWLGYGPDQLVLLACTLTYPTPDADGNFTRIEQMRQQFAPYLIGMSDHTLGVAGGWMTAALGGVCIEKHYTLDRSLPDVPDHAMSLDPTDLASLVNACDRACELRGESWIGPRPSEAPARELARRSIVVARDVARGTVLHDDDLAFKRPGRGMSPARVDEVIGRRTREAVPAGTLLSSDMLE